MTFEEWRAEVQLAYSGGDATEKQLRRVVADRVRSEMARHVESDLALANSYRTSFRDGLFEIAGTRITEDLSALNAAIREIARVEDDTAAVSVAMDEAIEAAYDDVNGAADRWDALLIEAALELQQHIPFFTGRQTTTYIADTADIVHEGFYSRIAPPAGMRFGAMFFAPYVAPLAAGTFVAGDLVESNGRIYEVTIGGLLDESDLEDGLTSENGDGEVLGALTFAFIRPVIFVPVRPFPWADRARLRAGFFSGGPLYTMSEQADQLWLYPSLKDGGYQFIMEWAGVKDTFDDADEVTFDKKAAACAAHYIKSTLAGEIAGDLKKQSTEFALFQRDLRGLLIDAEQRTQGVGNQMPEFNYFGPCMPTWLPLRGASGATSTNTGGGFSDITTLTELAAITTADTDLGTIIAFWNADAGQLQFWRLEETTAATGPGIQRGDDYEDGTNERAWVLLG